MFFARDLLGRDPELPREPFGQVLIHCCSKYLNTFVKLLRIMYPSIAGVKCRGGSETRPCGSARSPKVSDRGERGPSSPSGAVAPRRSGLSGAVAPRRHPVLDALRPRVNAPQSGCGCAPTETVGATDLMLHSAEQFLHGRPAHGIVACRRWRPPAPGPKSRAQPQPGTKGSGKRRSSNDPCCQIGGACPESADRLWPIADGQPPYSI